MCVRCSLVLSRGRSMELIPGMGLDWRGGFGFGFGFGSGDGVGLVDGRGGDAVELVGLVLVFGFVCGLCRLSFLW